MAQLFSLGGIAMIPILKSDKWFGYGALVCLAFVFLIPWIVPFPERTFGGYLVVGFVYGLVPVGFCLSLRGVFVIGWLNRICAGIALIIFSCVILGYIYLRVTVWKR